MENNKLISQLVTILKNERNFINISQTVEAVSVLILIRYFEVKSHFIENSKCFYNDNLTDYIHYCKSLINESTCSLHEVMDSKMLNELLIHPLENTFLKLEPYTVFNKLNPILSILRKERDFLYLAEDYRALIDSMAFESPQTGQFYTPMVINKLLVKILKPKCGDEIYDPACGSGGFLFEADRYIQMDTLCTQHRLVGSDISLFANIISFVSLILIGNKGFSLELIDSLSQEKNNRCYDVVASNPPFGKISKNNEVNTFKDNYLCLDYFFLKHVMDSLKDNGRAAVILPERFLFDKNESCVKLKNELFSCFNVEFILSIPPGSMLPATGVKIIVLCFSKSLPKKEVWIYLLSSVEKLSRKNCVKIEDFDDFFSKLKGRVVSENSWLVKIDGEIKYCDLLQRNIDFNQSRYFELPQKYLLEMHKNKINLVSSLDLITRKIEGLSNSINNEITGAKFTLFNVKSLIHSLPGKPLSKEQLLVDGMYEVYGGNGVIGYYDEYTHSGDFIIIGRVGAYCGNVRYVVGKFWGTSNAIILKCLDRNTVYPPYLARVLFKKELRKLASGTAQPHLTISKINAIDVYLPPLDVQIEIDKWLSELEKELELQQMLMEKMIDEKSAMKDSLYQHLLRI
ncbi:N-6 DNA methylase [Pectobacterium sp. CHL-2024]|uniref:N-6 DNA methylase n=1 Tax=Pectobacterium sp. CHL-2024 TaxID=3377079 RepID=UPI00382FBB93